MSIYNDISHLIHSESPAKFVRAVRQQKNCRFKILLSWTLDRICLLYAVYRSPNISSFRKGKKSRQQHCKTGDMERLLSARIVSFRSLKRASLLGQVFNGLEALLDNTESTFFTLKNWRLVDLCIKVEFRRTVLPTVSV